MKILITGGAGYIGSHIAEELIKSEDIVIIDNLSTGYKKLIPKKAKFFLIDLSQTKKINEVIKQENIDIIIHLAAKLSLQEAQKRPKYYYKNNVGGTESLLRAIKKTNVKLIIFSSTAAVYSGNNVIECKETLVPKPVNLYGKTKLIGEKKILNFTKNNQIKSIILRYFNVVGASKTNNIGPMKDYGQLFKRLSKSVIKNKPTISIFGDKHKTHDGTCVRDFIDINDIVNIHKLIIKNKNKIKKNIIMNCGYGNGISVLKLIKYFEIVKKSIKIKILKKRKVEISNIYANNKKITKIFGWKPMYQNIFLSIKRSVNWEKKIS